MIFHICGEVRQVLTPFPLLWNYVSLDFKDIQSWMIFRFWRGANSPWKMEITQIGS